MNSSDPYYATRSYLYFFTCLQQSHTYIINMLNKVNTNAVYIGSVPIIRNLECNMVNLAKDEI